MGTSPASLIRIARIPETGAIHHVWHAWLDRCRVAPYAGGAYICKITLWWVRKIVSLSAGEAYLSLRLSITYFAITILASLTNNSRGSSPWCWKFIIETYLTLGACQWFITDLATVGSWNGTSRRTLCAFWRSTLHVVSLFAGRTCSYCRGCALYTYGAAFSEGSAVSRIITSH